MDSELENKVEYWSTSVIIIWGAINRFLSRANWFKDLNKQATKGIRRTFDKSLN